MSDFKVASRYAKSLLDLSIEQGVVEEVHSDMRTFDNICRQSRDFYLMLKNPIINPHKKLKILDEIFSKKFHKVSMSIFRLITQKQRESYLPSICRQFLFQYNIYKGIETAEVTTTFPLTENLRKEFITVVRNMTGKKVELEEKVDKEILGGFVLKFSDRQVDDSLSGKLKELKLKFQRNQQVTAL